MHRQPTLLPAAVTQQRPRPCPDAWLGTGMKNKLPFYFSWGFGGILSGETLLRSNAVATPEIQRSFTVIITNV